MYDKIRVLKRRNRQFMQLDECGLVEELRTYNFARGMQDTREHDNLANATAIDQCAWLIAGLYMI
jgi:hypothetical protein